MADVCKGDGDRYFFKIFIYSVNVYEAAILLFNNFVKFSIIITSISDFIIIKFILKREFVRVNKDILVIIHIELFVNAHLEGFGIPLKQPHFEHFIMIRNYPKSLVNRIILSVIEPIRPSMLELKEMEQRSVVDVHYKSCIGNRR